MSDTKVLLIDFDGTLTAEHTGGALFVEMSDGDRCWRPALGEGTLTSNVASHNAGWTFAVLWHFVMTEKVCVAIVTMADEKHGNSLRQWLDIRNSDSSGGSQQWSVLAGRDLVLQWLRCAARKFCGGRDGGERMVAALCASGRFFIDAHFHADSKVSHVRNALAYFASQGSLDTATLRNNELLMIDDSLPLLRDIQRHLDGIEVAHVTLGLCSLTYDLICSNRAFVAAAVESTSTQKQ